MSERSKIDGGAQKVCQLVGSLDIPTPWDIDAFVDTVARTRGKPIRMLAHAGPTGAGHPCGIWIGRETDDIIVYDAGTSSYHTEQIILHEIGHLLLEHGGINDGAESALSIHDLLPDIEPAVVTHVLGRTAYDDDQESQAELFASLMMSESRKVQLDSPFLGAFLRG